MSDKPSFKPKKVGNHWIQTGEHEWQHPWAGIIVTEKGSDSLSEKFKWVDRSGQKTITFSTLIEARAGAVKFSRKPLEPML